MITAIYLGNEKLDQYKDEGITVTNRVLDITEIDKNKTDSSNAFTVPASARNNRIFRHYYNINIDNTYDARKTQKGTIEVGGMPYKDGKWQLLKVNVQNGLPISYVLNFSGKLTSIKDLAANLELRDLDLTAYDHPYNSTNVKTGLTSYGLKSGDVVYTLLAKKRYIYNSDINDNTQTEQLANVAFVVGGGADVGVIWNDLKPSLKLIRIIEAIEIKLGVTFSRDFFGTSEFSDLFLWLNPDKSTNNTNFKIVNFDGGSEIHVNRTTNIGTFQTIPFPPTGVTPNKFKLSIKITPESGYTSTRYTIKYYQDGEVRRTWDNVIGTFETNGDDIILQNNIEDQTFQIYWEVESEQEFSYTAIFYQGYFINNTNQGQFISTASTDTIPSAFIVSENIPKMKIIDFLKGLFSMFKLVVVANSETDYYIDKTRNYYAKGRTWDVTKYIDFSKYGVERGKIFNTISFKFQEPQTILNQQYLQNNAVGYGDEDLKLYTDSTETELLDGDSYEIELPFEQIVYERLFDIAQDNVQTRVQYGAIIDESLNPANPKAHIHYTGLARIASLPVAFINDTGVKEVLDDKLTTPLHSNSFTFASFTTTFDDTFSTWNAVKFDNNLYTNHYKSYIEDIFNIKKRTFKFKAHLPLHVVTKLDLNDALFIKGNYYRIDNYSYNLLDGLTDLELVNLASEDAIINPILTSTNSIYVSKEPITKYEQLINTAEAIPSKLDMGSGTTWITLALSATIPNLLEIAFLENTSGVDRDMILEITVGGQTARIYLYQYGSGLTVDNGIVTVDSNLITVDNG
jgi:hypothetical protein